MKASKWLVVKKGCHLMDPSVEIDVKEIVQDGSEDHTIIYGVSDSPFGEFFVAVSVEGIEALYLTGGRADDIVREYRLKNGYSWMLRDDTFAHHLAHRLLADQHHGDIRIILTGTPFQVKVWSEVMNIPCSETVSYAELAQRVGKPGAVRAVANAVGRNEVAFVIPCHRVVRTDGTLGGFRWGLDAKVQMLNWEKERKNQVEVR